jgi:Zinc dependent phospholipase C
MKHQTIREMTLRVLRFATLICLLLGFVRAVNAYSVLSHEAIIDSAWDASIKPLLLARFLHATQDDLRKAHGFAYGGAIIQDMGYYPGGNHFFSDLTHYVRTADFVEALLKDSLETNDINDFAFALGALAHYSADNSGHSLAVNRSVPMLYPKVRKKFGDMATYEDNPADHLKAEFGFDVLEIAKQRYAPDAYHDFIGFDISTPLLERAFKETYGIELRSLFKNLDHTLGTYRYSVSSLIPKATKIAWAMKKDEIERDIPSMTQRKFLYNLSRSSYEKSWGKDYQRPGFGSKILALLIRILPKVGPLSALSFRTPTPQAENLFMTSFNTTIDEYKGSLAEVRTQTLAIDNRNFDTGQPTLPGKYFMADNAYAKLVDELAKNQFADVPAALRENILSYYSDGNAPIATKKKRKDWARVSAELQQLRSATAVRDE